MVKQNPVGPGVREEPRVRERRGQLQREAGVLGCPEGRPDWAPEGALRSSEAGAGGSAVFPPLCWSRRVRAAELMGLSACSVPGTPGPREGRVLPTVIRTGSRSAKVSGWPKVSESGLDSI